MATQAQIEAVARAIWESYEGEVAGVHFDDPIVKGNAFREGKAMRQAEAAIAAIEAARPAVSDEELYQVYWDAAYTATARHPDTSSIDAHYQMHMAGIRAVRERLGEGGDDA